jgi:hypothetical protein
MPSSCFSVEQTAERQVEAAVAETAAATRLPGHTGYATAVLWCSEGRVCGIKSVGVCCLTLPAPCCMLCQRLTPATCTSAEHIVFITCSMCHPGQQV